MSLEKLCMLSYNFVTVSQAIWMMDIFIFVLYVNHGNVSEEYQLSIYQAAVEFKAVILVINK